jgi:hypothetical protein
MAGGSSWHWSRDRIGEDAGHRARTRDKENRGGSAEGGNRYFPWRGEDVGHKG